MTDGKSPSDSVDVLPWWPKEPAMGLAEDPRDAACSAVRLECFLTTVNLQRKAQGMSAASI